MGAEFQALEQGWPVANYCHNTYREALLETYKKCLIVKNCHK